MSRFFYPVVLLLNWLGLSRRLLPMQTTLQDLQQDYRQSQRQQQLLQQKLDEISHASQELEQSAILVTRNAEQQSQSANTTAAAVEELNVSILQVAELATSSREASIEAGKRVEQSSQQLTLLMDQLNHMAREAQAANQRMQALQDSSRTISEVSTAIGHLADQTNLLALNAAIEAARAGDAGRGFAVVADEVRQLAQHSLNSSTRINQIIAEVQQQIQSTGKQMQEFSQQASRSVADSEQVRSDLDRALQQTRILTEQVVQVAVSTGQQSAAAAEIAQLADQVREGNTSNLQAADQARTVAHHLAHLTADKDS
ncbi:MAG: chemotaxis protein [Marinospirillum sp.]|uniref:methyl-accepting chemotaxis protein n=1 Tax=Marinospirillum sp. TaxID=2183934 RepID=UPI001A06378F|nr:methyl-accepting chemotaxis protein [Marinospirillum sp.]MBE0506843.1 chemotaxis protein [Marinospirillum sp.]